MIDLRVTEKDLLNMDIDKRHITLQSLLEYAQQYWKKIKSPSESEITGFLQIVLRGKLETQIKKYFLADINFLSSSSSNRDNFKEQIKILKFWWLGYTQDLYENILIATEDDVYDSVERIFSEINYFINFSEGKIW
ncbi:hypothetical protein [Spiroplasma endosymbiont of Labia minor]|uniref:hypothetical protein n=1 Tax=Spiroplasma endosymbiont of Labia minor TaxID=3066305 RepID=UPI0030D17C58